MLRVCFFLCVFRFFFLGGGFRHCYQPKRRSSRILCGQQHNYPDFATVGASCCSIAAKWFCVQRRAGLRVPQQQLRRCQQCCSIPDRCWPIPLLGVSSFSSLYNNWYKTGWPFSFNFLSILFLVGLLSFTFHLFTVFFLSHACSLSFSPQDRPACKSLKNTVLMSTYKCIVFVFLWFFNCKVRWLARN